VAVEAGIGRVTTLGVLGAGTMGAGIVLVAAEGGIVVLVHDPLAGSVARARDRIGGYLLRKVEKGTLESEAADHALRRIREVSDVASLVMADAVIEAIPEDLDLKREAFTTLDAAAPSDVLLASNTSSLSIASIASATRHAARVAGMHFFNPVPLMRLVEVVAGPATSEGCVAATSALAEQLGKSPVISADSPGFIVNRVQRALYLEGYRMLAEGTPLDAIDDALRGIGFRLGPFELADLVGTDVNLAAGKAIHAIDRSRSSSASWMPGAWGARRSVATTTTGPMARAARPGRVPRFPLRRAFGRCQRSRSRRGHWRPS
jgi:3-hydroxybutyryl-CoA dehydrogenase